MAMTSQEIANLLIVKKLPHTFVMLVDGLGWTYKEIVYLTDIGIMPQQIEDCLNMGVSYDDIKYLAQTKKLDDIENALFAEPIKIKGESSAATACNIALGIGNAAGKLLFKLGRAVGGR